MRGRHDFPSLNTTQACAFWWIGHRSIPAPGDLTMRAAMPGIWFRITNAQENNQDHTDQTIHDPTNDPNRHFQSLTGLTSSRPNQTKQRQQPGQAIIDGYGQMLSDRLADGWSAYLVSVVFQHLSGSRQVVLNRMKDEVQRVYSTLVTKVHKRPRTAPIDKLPVLIGVADLPVFKWNGTKASTSCNDGLHFHAILMLPPTSRLKESVVEHFQSNADRSLGPRELVERIHVKPITHDYQRVVDYVFKAVINRRIPYEEALLVLPRARSELAARERLGDGVPVHTRTLPLLS